MLTQRDPLMHPTTVEHESAESIAGTDETRAKAARGRARWRVVLSVAVLVAVLLAVGGGYIVQQSRVQPRSLPAQPIATVQPNPGVPRTGPGQPTPVTRLPVNIPAAQLAWTQPTASGDARSAFAASARVNVQQPDGSVRQQAPVGVLWLAETPRAALALVTLDTSGDVDVLPMDRASASDSWQVSPGTMPPAKASNSCGSGFAIPAPLTELGPACGLEEVGPANGSALRYNMTWTQLDGSSWFAARIAGAPTGVGAPASGSGQGFNSASAVLANGQGVLALASTASADRVQATLAAIQSSPPSPLTTDS